MMTETTFSHDSDLEEAVIGACMIERAAMPLVADKLRPEMFYEEKNLEIFAALQSMYRSAKSIDTITLKNELAAVANSMPWAGLTNCYASARRSAPVLIWSIMRSSLGNCTRGVSCVRDSSNCWRSVPTSRWILTTFWWKPIDCWRGWRTRAA